MSSKWLKRFYERLGFRLEHVNQNTVDLCLGRKIKEFKVFDSNEPLPDDFYYVNEMQYPLNNDINCMIAVREVEYEKGDSIVFVPGSFYLADTEEYLKFPKKISSGYRVIDFILSLLGIRLGVCGKLFLKSSGARKSLEHHHAGVFDVGFEGTGTLEFTTHLPIELTIGQRIVQMEYSLVVAPEEEDLYTTKGRYLKQTGPTEVRRAIAGQQNEQFA